MSPSDISNEKINEVNEIRLTEKKKKRGSRFAGLINLTKRIRDAIPAGIRRLRNNISDKDSKFEDVLSNNAIYSSKEWREVDILSILGEYDYSQISMGLSARVYKINDLNWVFKESRWDLSMDLFPGAKIPLPARLVQWVLKFFKYLFLPDQKQVQEDYRGYLEFSQYFGYFEYEDDFPHPNRDALFIAQRNIRSNLRFFRRELEEYYKFEFHSSIEQIFADEKLLKNNFLPREYQLVGKSISRHNDSKVTSFIFQEYIEGKELYDVSKKGLSVEQKKQLALMIYLILLMRMQIGLLPDTRPKYPMFQAYNWLTMTDNIMVGKDGELKFIDTRWFWDTNSNFIRQGLIIPRLVISRAKKEVNELLREL